jgi:hypothetical protein
VHGRYGGSIVNPAVRVELDRWAMDDEASPSVVGDREDDIDGIGELISSRGQASIAAS